MANFLTTVLAGFADVPQLPGFAPSKSTPIVPIAPTKNGTVLPLPVTVGPTSPIGTGKSPIGGITVPPASLGPLPANAGQGTPATGASASPLGSIGDTITGAISGIAGAVTAPANNAVGGAITQAENWAQWLAVNWVIGLVFLIALFAFLTQTGAGKVVVQTVKEGAKDAATAAVVA